VAVYEGGSEAAGGDERVLAALGAARRLVGPTGGGLPYCAASARLRELVRGDLLRCRTPLTPVVAAAQLDALLRLREGDIRLYDAWASRALRAFTGGGGGEGDAGTAAAAAATAMLVGGVVATDVVWGRRMWPASPLQSSALAAVVRELPPEAGGVVPPPPAFDVAAARASGDTPAATSRLAAALALPASGAAQWAAWAGAPSLPRRDAAAGTLPPIPPSLWCCSNTLVTLFSRLVGVALPHLASTPAPDAPLLLAFVATRTLAHESALAAASTAAAAKRADMIIHAAAVEAVPSTAPVAVIKAAAGAARATPPSSAWRNAARLLAGAAGALPVRQPATGGDAGEAVALATLAAEVCEVAAVARGGFEGEVVGVVPPAAAAIVAAACRASAALLPTPPPLAPVTTLALLAAFARASRAVDGLPLAATPIIMPAGTGGDALPPPPPQPLARLDARLTAAATVAAPPAPPPTPATLGDALASTYRALTPALLLSCAPPPPPAAAATVTAGSPLAGWEAAADAVEHCVRVADAAGGRTAAAATPFGLRRAARAWLVYAGGLWRLLGAAPPPPAHVVPVASLPPAVVALHARIPTAAALLVGAHGYATGDSWLATPLGAAPTPGTLPLVRSLPVDAPWLPHLARLGVASDRLATALTGASGSGSGGMSAASAWPPECLPGPAPSWLAATLALLHAVLPLVVVAPAAPPPPVPSPSLPPPPPPVPAAETSLAHTVRALLATAASSEGEEAATAAAALNTLLAADGYGTLVAYFAHMARYPPLDAETGAEEAQRRQHVGEEDDDIVAAVELEWEGGGGEADRGRAAAAAATDDLGGSGSGSDGGDASDGSDSELGGAAAVRRSIPSNRRAAAAVGGQRRPLAPSRDSDDEASGDDAPTARRSARAADDGALLSDDSDSDVSSSGEGVRQGRRRGTAAAADAAAWGHGHLPRSVSAAMSVVLAYGATAAPGSIAAEGRTALLARASTRRV